MRVKLHSILLLNGFIATFTCCHNFKATTSETAQNKTEQAAYQSDAHSSSNSLDWAGTYFGILPCADCEGIKTELTLNQDKTYSFKTSYIGKGNQTSAETGTFAWNDAGNTITLSGAKNRPKQYFVAENKIIQLDMDGNKITGSLADNYILKKQ